MKKLKFEMYISIKIIFIFTVAILAQAERSCSLMPRHTKIPTKWT